jgi:hypothetical protein
MSLFTAVVSVGLGDFAYRGTWCWISGTPPWLEMLYFYGPMGIVSLLSCVMWIRVMYEMRRGRKEYLVVLLRHLVMAAVFFIIFVAMFAHRLYNAISGVDNFVLIEMHIIALGGVGIWLFFIFGVSKHNLQIFRDYLNHKDYEQLN